MARARLNDPIFFSKTGGNPVNQLPYAGEQMAMSQVWKSIMPDAAALTVTQIDPSLGGFGGFAEVESVGEDIANVLNLPRGKSPTAEQITKIIIGQARSSGMNELISLANTDTIRALRGVIGNVAMTVGFTRNAMQGNVRNVFAEPLRTVAQALEMLNRVVNSEYFQKAVEGISWIPIVGWIIAIVAEILTLVANISARVRAKRITEMNMELAKMTRVPLLSADPDLQRAANEQQTKRILRWLETYELWMAFMPPYKYPSGSNVESSFAVQAARDPKGDADYIDENGDRVNLTQAWYLGGPSFGGGSVPGGLEMYSLLEFLAGHGSAAPRTVGQYMVTARQMATQLWQLVLSSGEPALFTIDTDFHRRAWDDYVHALFVYGEQCVLKGFTMSRSGRPCSGDHWCYDDAPSFCRRRDVGKVVKWPGGLDGVTHFPELVAWLTTEFWGRGPDKTNFPYDVRDRGKQWDPDNFYYQNTIYAEALRQLHEQQWSYLGGYEAMYVHPAKEFEDTFTGTTQSAPRGIFPALANDSQLRKRWGETVTLILNDRDLWRQVNWQDVPAYRFWGQSPREILRQKWNNQASGWLTAGGQPPPVPGGPQDYPPPPPPALPGQNVTIARLAQLGPREAPPGPPTASKIMFGGSVAAAATAASMLIYNKVARVFFS